jgi:hypothetical protein
MAAFVYPLTTIGLTAAATVSGTPNLTVQTNATGSLGAACGAVLSHANIPVGTKILYYSSATNAVMSANATVTGSGLTVNATNPSVIHYDDVPGVVGATTLKGGGASADTFAINGLTFVIDSHVRYGRNSYVNTGAASCHLSSISPSAALGGNILIDGRYIRLIPIDTAAGTLTHLTAVTVTQGSATGVLIGFYTSLLAAPITGVGTPAAITGATYALIRSWNETEFTAGAITFSNGGGVAVTANATGPSRVGWLDINGDDGATYTGNRLNKFEIKGAWYEIGTTTGNRATTYNVPNNGLQLWVPAVFVQGATWTITGATWAAGVATFTTSATHDMLVGQQVTVAGISPAGFNCVDQYITDLTDTTFKVAMADPGSAYSSGGTAVAYELWPCAGTLTALAANFMDENTRRGKVFWNTNATTSLALPLGYIRFGHDGTNSTGGYCPPSGRKIRIGNVFLNNNTTAARNQNSIPHATHATRYDFTMTGAGRIDFDKMSMNWYPSFVQAQAVTIRNSGIMSQLWVNECPTPLVLRNLCVGQEAAAVGIPSLNANYNPAGVLMENCVFTMAATSGTTQHNPAALSYCKDVVATDCIGWLYGTRTGGSKQTNFTFCENLLTNRWHNVNSRLYLNTCANSRIKDTKHTDTTGLTRNSANTQQVISATGIMSGTVIEGVKFVGLKAQCCSELVSANTAIGPVSVRNMGTLANPLNTAEGPYYNKNWNRVTTVCTVDHVAHGFQAGDIIQVFHTTSTSAFGVSAKTILAGGLTADQFTFTCTNGGDSVNGKMSYFWVPVHSCVLAPTGSVDIKVQRLYPLLVRNFIMSGDNTSRQCHCENSFQTMPIDPTQTGMANGVMLNSTSKLGGAPYMTAAPSVYGTDWIDGPYGHPPDSAACTWARTGTTVKLTLVTAGHYMNQISNAAPVIQVLTTSDETALNTGYNVAHSFTTGGPLANEVNLTGQNTGASSGTCTIANETGRVTLYMNEGSPDNVNYELGASNSVDAGFNGQGGLVLPVVGDTITHTCPYWIRGHTGFVIAPPLMAGGTIANYDIEYQIDTGSGWSGWKNCYRQTLTAVADWAAGAFTITGIAAGDTWINNGDYLNRASATYDLHRAAKVASGGATGRVGGTTTLTMNKAHSAVGTDRVLAAFAMPGETIDPEVGFKLKIRITTLIANSTAITYISFRTFQTAASRAFQLPLDSITLQLTGIQTGSDITVRTAGTETIRENTENFAGTTFNYIYEDAGAVVDIDIYKPGYIPYLTIRNFTLPATASSLPITQVQDPSYLL